MRRRIGRRNWEIYAWDTETHADAESLTLNETGVWLVSFINDESKVEDDGCYFYSLESWLDHLEELTAKERRKHRKDSPAKCSNILIYDFNLSFEWSFLLPVLLKRGFAFKETIEKDDDHCFNTISTKTCSSVWKINLKFSKNGGMVQIRDLHKIFAGSLRSIAKAMKLPTQKGEIDYTINRRHGWKVTQEEKTYCFNDTHIILDIIGEMAKQDDKEFFSSVSAATYSCKKMLKAGYPRSYRPYKAYRKQYPQLGDEEGNFIHNSVAGGLTYAPSRWQFVDIKAPIKHIDYHQSYPSTMASQRHEYFPYGFGKYGKGQPKFNPFRRYCCHILIGYSGCKLHSVIKLIGLDCIDDVELYVWDFEIKVLKEAYYDLDIQYIDYYEYKTKRLPFANYFKENYAKRLEAKKEGNAFFVFLYKLLNNSCYGKFEENPHTFVLENYVNEHGQIDSIIHDKQEATYGQFTYYPVGSCISAYARSRLIHDALTLSPTGEDILYMDTDSLFYLDNETTRENIKKLWVGEELGAFGFEDDIKEAQFTAPKRYKLVHVDGVSEIKAGGITLDEDATFENTNLVNGEFSARTHIRAHGGTLIAEKPKAIKVQGKYKEAYLKNAEKVYNK